MTTKISNFDDVIDSRDVIARIEELESERDDFQEDHELAELDLEEWNETENGQEYKTLKALAEQCEGYGDWQYGETLIRDSYFEDYAQELAEDCGYIQKDVHWPYTCIDWEQAARELQMDYMQVDFDGVDYWMRA